MPGDEAVVVKAENSESGVVVDSDESCVRNDNFDKLRDVPAATAPYKYL